MEKIYFKLVKEREDGSYTWGIIKYSLTGGTYQESIICGNVPHSNRPFSKSVVNAIIEDDSFESVSRDFVYADFSYLKGWEIEEIAFEDWDDIDSIVKDMEEEFAQLEERCANS